MRAAIYARFSSENQREQSIEDQIRVCREFAKRDGITILESHIYFDEAQSGSAVLFGDSQSEVAKLAHLLDYVARYSTS